LIWGVIPFWYLKSWRRVNK